MASPIGVPLSNTKFQLDKAIVAPEGSLTVDIAASTAHDVPQGASVSHRASPLAAL